MSSKQSKMRVSALPVRRRNLSPFVILPPALVAFPRRIGYKGEKRRKERERKEEGRICCKSIVKKI
jgi:hypothetical protein